MLRVIFAALICLVQATDKRVSVTNTVFKSPIDDIKWFKHDHSTVLLRTSDGLVFQSTDHGKSFHEITTRITSKPVAIKGILRNNKNPMIVAVFSEHGEYYLSNNAGASWRTITIPNLDKISTLNFHPSNKNVLLATGWINVCRSDPDDRHCNKEAWISRDGGHQWTRTRTHVVSAKFSSTNPDLLLLTYHEDQDQRQPRGIGWHHGISFGKYDMHQHEFQQILSGGNKFLMQNHYTFVAVKKDGVQGVQLYVSTDESNFSLAKFPFHGNPEERSYTILDSSSGAVVIQVQVASDDPTETTGNIYVSDESGINFHLSLANNVRATNGESEFEVVKGVNGIFIANYYDHLGIQTPDFSESESYAEYSSSFEDSDTSVDNALRRRTLGTPVRTVMTFNKGGTWQSLRPPSVDSLGKRIECNYPDCALHLHGISKFHYFAPFYSVESAPGIIMGVGNVGESLSMETHMVNTYISSDAGRTWAEAHKGNYIYEFGDHGGLIVMADDANKTNQIIFSWNEGEQWFDFTLGDDSMTVENIVMEPTSGHNEMLIYGLDGGRGVLYHLDFNTLGMPKCRNPHSPDSASSDYYSWSPSAPGRGDGQNCLMGRTTVYTRRKTVSQCFNGRDFVRPSETHFCDCTKDDYSCAFGFYRPVNSNGDNDCIPDPSGYSSPDCRRAHIVHVNPYYKTPGNACINGWVPSTTPILCTVRSKMGGDSVAMLVGTTLMLCAVGVISYISSNPTIRNRIIPNIHYSVLRINGKMQRFKNSDDVEEMTHEEGNFNNNNHLSNGVEFWQGNA